ncbi:MAG: excinuclease ABC subunit C [Myxococcota bacterium]|jgi:excinuclease ABC subunit C
MSLDLPTGPGVYLFKNKKGKVLYIGKAKNLKSRVRQYILGQDERFMVPFLVARSHDIEVIVVDSEKEALLLENTLIKEHRPKYNIKLRDDSAFLRMRINPKDPWPMFKLVRRFGRDKAKYFGPYHSASRARQTLEFVQRNFPLRTCSDAVLRSRSRPCLLHQMGRCAAPCVDLVSREEYAKLVEEAMWFLDGKTGPLKKRLKARMMAAAEAERFEEAARLRDLLVSIDKTLEAQNVVEAGDTNRDVWGLYREGSRGVVSIVPVREGHVSQPVSTVFDNLTGDDNELFSSLLNQTYDDGIPPEILIPITLDDAEVLSDVLSERQGSKVRVHTPLRGSKVRLVEMAMANAKVRFEREHDEESRRESAMESLQDILKLPTLPRRIECFDNSNLAGNQPVAAMSVLIDGKPDRAEYRRYRIKTVVGADDYASMREILFRRVKRALEGTGAPLPDLLVVDGGRGQLTAAMAALHDLGVHDQPIIGISKPRTDRKKGDRGSTDRLVLPHIKDPIRLAPHDPALRLVQYARDEVHKHAITYHRQVRRKETLASVLEGIEGVGPSRRKALLSTLGSASAVALADTETLAAVPGIGPGMAETIYRALHPVE